MQSPFSDPLSFWTRVLFRLGIVLALVALGPAVIDFVFFKGQAVIIATIALYSLAPLAVLCLIGAALLWGIGLLRR